MNLPPILILAAFAALAVAYSETAHPLDAVALKSMLVEKPKRLIAKGPVSPVVKRWYGRSAKGVNIEIVD